MERKIGDVWRYSKAEAELALFKIRMTNKKPKPYLIELPWDQKVTHYTVKFLDAVIAGFKKRQAYKTRWQKVKEWVLVVLEATPYIAVWWMKKKIAR